MKKNFTRFLKLFWPLALALALLAVTALADFSLPGSLSVIDAEAFMNDVSLTGPLNIPAGVSYIGPRAFDGCTGITSLTLPNGLATIGSRAFADCTGMSGTVYIPASVTSLAEDAFDGTPVTLVFEGDDDDDDNVVTMTDLPAGLSYEMTDDGCVITGYTGQSDGTLVIPAAIDGIPVVAIGDYAFQNCSELTGSIVLPGSVSRIGNGAFYGCVSLSGGLTIPSSVTYIGSFAFYECLSLSGSLAIPASVNMVGESAFAFCEGMTGSLTLPDNITLGARCFQGSGFTGSLTITPGMNLGANVFAGTRLDIIWLAGSFSYDQSGAAVTITGWNGPLNEGLTIPTYLGTGMVTGIAAEAFADIGLQGTVSLPASVVYIGDSAFRSNPGITGISFSEGLVTISPYAFADCTGLSGVIVLPSTVKVLADTAFAGVDVTVEIAPAD